MVLFLKFLNKYKNNKGTSFLYKATEYLTFLYITAFLLDVIILIGQFMVVSYITGFFSSVLGIQGGLIGATGIDSKYSAQSVILGSSEMTNAQIIKKVNDLFYQFGIKEADWKMTVNGKVLYEFGVPSKTDLTTQNRKQYADIGDAKLQFKYRWKFSSAILPGDFETLVTSNGAFFSEII